MNLRTPYRFSFSSFDILDYNMYALFDIASNG